MPDLEYYEALGITKDSSHDQIKKAYYKAALACHPDRFSSSDEATKNIMERKFKFINEAYQVLSDPQSRDLYDKGGKNALDLSKSTFVDPHVLFRSFFGGEAFVDIIGELGLVQIVSMALKSYEEQDNSDKIAISAHSEENSIKNDIDLTIQQKLEIKQARSKRVIQLAHKLASRLDLYCCGNQSLDFFKNTVVEEVSQLKNESFGPELLKTVGHIYHNKAKQFLGKDSFLGLSAFYYGVKEKGHIVGQLYNTVSAVSDVLNDERLKRNTSREHEKYQEIPPSGSIANIDENKLMRLIWQLGSLDVESVLRDVCDAVLKGPLAKSRAEALKVLGDLYRKHDK